MSPDLPCPDCGAAVALETERITDPGAPHRETTVAYCPACGEVQSACP